MHELFIYEIKKDITVDDRTVFFKSEAATNRDVLYTKIKNITKTKTMRLILALFGKHMHMKVTGKRFCFNFES